MAYYERMVALAEEYNALKIDRERLVFLKQHNDIFKVLISEDDTKATFIKPVSMDQKVFEDTVEELELNKFEPETNSMLWLFEQAGISVQ